MTHPSMWQNTDMKTVQFAIDKTLLERVDSLVKLAGTTRSDFIHEALRHEIQRRENEKREQEHRTSFERIPQSTDETWMPSRPGWTDQDAARADGLDALKTAFADLEPNARTSLIDEAQTWARAKINAPAATGRIVSREKIGNRFPKR
jgi:predicted transcriptional regulator